MNLKLKKHAERAHDVKTEYQLHAEYAKHCHSDTLKTNGKLYWKSKNINYNLKTHCRKQCKFKNLCKKKKKNYYNDNNNNNNNNNNMKNNNSDNNSNKINQ